MTYTPLPDHLLPEEQSGVSLPNKEQISSSYNIKTPELSTLMEVHDEPTVGPDLTEHIDVQHENPIISEELTDHGVVGSQVGQATVPKPLTLGLTDTAIERGLQQPLSSSYRWLSELAKYMLFSVQHVVLKIKGGKVVREHIALPKDTEAI